MSLATGARLGPYEVVSPIGAGGMGEVYRARDTKLNRDVALKILPDAFAADPDRLARFKREAQVLASLNHPNIAQIHGFEDSSTTHALVMELVEGPTLADLIDGARGLQTPGPTPGSKDPGLHLTDALAIAGQIADALECAHESGIIHRDLKPANVKVRDDGTVKVLDFGLARISEVTATGGGTERRNTDDSPTLTTPAMTAMGLILGTAAYMSPEQAKGRVVDKRADIWAFGVVLYEMLTGRPLFDGDSVAETIGFVATRDPDWTALPASTPARVRRLLARCLTRDPKHRLRDIGEARIALAAPDNASTDLKAAGEGPAVPVGARANVRERTLWMGAAVVLAVLTGVVAWWVKPTPPETPNVVTRFNQPLPEGQRVNNTGRHALAISPDGTKLAYIANGQIYLRGMDQLEAQPVRGTNEGPWEVMFSPDSQWIGYFTRTAGLGATLKKILIGGGAPMTLSQIESVPYGASWRGNTIVFALTGSKTNTVQTVADSGGPPRSIVTFDADKEVAFQAQLLDDGARVLMSVLARGSSLQDGADIVVQSIDSGARTVLVRGGSDPRILSTGHLVYLKDATIFAVAIDTTRLELRGGAVPLVDGVFANSGGGVAQFAIADNGTLAFAPGVPEVLPRRTLVWVDRKGQEEPLSAKPRAYHHLRLSPDRKQVAVEIRDEENDIWIWDLAREALTRLTIGATHEGYPVWTHDGRSVLYRSFDASGTTVFRKAADGTGATEKLIHDPEDASPQSLSRDGKHLVYRSATVKTRRDLMLMPIDPIGPPKPLIQTEFTEDNGQVSPDGRWIAYESNDSGERDVFVRPFPAVDTSKVPVSSGGGSFAKWSPDGRQLFYLGRANGDTVMAFVEVPVLPAGAKFTSGKPQLLFSMANYLIGATQSYDVSQDGRRLLLIKRPAITAGTAPPPSITVVTHWFEELRARVTGK